jgi:hypothetical protein
MIKKTYKREVATALLGFFCVIVWTGNVTMVETIMWPIFTFAGLAFGLDVYTGVQQLTSGKTPRE